MYKLGKWKPSPKQQQVVIGTTATWYIDNNSDYKLALQLKW